jgi:hypothetical protein
MCGALFGIIVSLFLTVQLHQLVNKKTLILRICYYGLWAISCETVYCIGHTRAEVVTVVQRHPLKCITVIHKKTFKNIFTVYKTMAFLLLCADYNSTRHMTRTRLLENLENTLLRRKYGLQRNDGGKANQSLG